MTTTPPPESALAQQLRADMEAITASEPQVNRWASGTWPFIRDLQREKERVRVLTGYVSYLITKVDELERRLR